MLIHAEPERKWGYKDFAKDFNCSPDHFRHVFVAEVGLGLPHYLLEMRLLLAVQLLNTTELTLQQIAAQIGMSSELTLRRAFKTKLGVCPSDYRNNVTESRKIAESVAK